MVSATPHNHHATTDANSSPRATILRHLQNRHSSHPYRHFPNTNNHKPPHSSFNFLNRHPPQIWRASQIPNLCSSAFSPAKFHLRPFRLSRRLQRRVRPRIRASSLSTPPSTTVGMPLLIRLILFFTSLLLTLLVTYTPE